MADDRVDRGSLEAHVDTYNGVTRLLFWGTIAAVIVAGLVILLIAT